MAPRSGGGIIEALEQHHPMPSHMGGGLLQDRAPLRKSLHRELHGLLRRAFLEAGFPNVGGKLGSKDVWLSTPAGAFKPSWVSLVNPH